MRRRFFLISLLLATAAPFYASQASITSGSSLEWLAESNDHIGVYRFGGPDMDFVLHTTLWGHPPRGREKMQALRNATGGPDAPSQGTEFLVFFDPRGQMTAFINLDTPFPPTRSGGGYPAVTKNGKLLYWKELILGTVRNQLVQRKARGGLRQWFARPILLDEQSGTKEALEAFWKKNAAFLRVPYELSARGRLLESSSSESACKRVRAACALGNFPGRDTVARLKELLHDPSLLPMGGAVSLNGETGKWLPVFTHQVRAAAYVAKSGLRVC